MSDADDESAPMAGDTRDSRSKMDILRDDIQEKFGSDEPAQLPLTQSLAIVVPIDVPRVVVTIHSPTAEKAVEQLRKIPKSVPERVARHPVQIELRLDALGTDNDRAQAVFLVARLGVPVIVTHRSPREGGENHTSDAERQDLLKKIFASLSEPFPPGSLIDLEASSLASDPAGWKEVVLAARAKNLLLMVSHHDHNATPSDPENLLPPESLLQSAPGGEALLYKSATRTRSWGEELAVLAALRTANHKHRRYALMGMGRPTTRLLAPFFGAPLVYASTPGAAPAAPGQIPFDDLLNTWCRWGVKYTDQGLLGQDNDEPPPRLALLGRPALHSLSPAMHNQAALAHGLPHRYMPLQPPGDDDPETVLRETLDWLPRLGIIGGNATSPFKAALAKSADRLEGPAEALDAANTFRYENDELVVTNTDVNGIRAPLEQAGLQIAQQDVLILGAGAAAAAAAYAVRDAKSIHLANRTQERADALAKRLRDHAPLQIVPWNEREQTAKRATLVIQATMMGMAGTPGESQNPLPSHRGDENQTVYELIYEPRLTPLLSAAKESGARTLTGLQMLLAQGAHGYTFWTGKEAPLDVMQQAVEQAEAIALPKQVTNAMEAVPGSNDDTALGGDTHGR